MPITATSISASNSNVGSSDPILNSISALKQLLQQQKKPPVPDKGSLFELASPSRSQQVEQDGPLRNHGSIDTLRTKLEDAEQIARNERALRSTLEKAFEDLSQNRKLLQDQLNQMQLKVENQSNRPLDESATTFTPSKNDGKEAETDRVKEVLEATALLQEKQLSWEKERGQLNKAIQLLKEEAIKDKKDAECKLLEQKQSYTSEIESLQQKLQSLREELSSLQNKQNEKLAAPSTDVEREESSKEYISSEIEGFKRDRDTILMMIKNVSPDGATVQPGVDEKESTNTNEGNSHATPTKESDLVAQVRNLISQLQVSQSKISTLEASLVDTKKEVENLEHALVKAENRTSDSSVAFDEATHKSTDDIQSDTDSPSTEKQNLKEEVRTLRGALKDAIGEASRSQRILDSLETRLHDKKLLATYCEKLKKEKDELMKISHAKILIEGETECISTVNISETIREDGAKAGAPSDINIQLYETRELLEQNKKLVTILQLRIQKFESDIGVKDSQIESLKQELQSMKHEHGGSIEEIQKGGIEYSMSHEDEEDEDEDDDEDDLDDDQDEDDLDDDQDEENDSEHAENSEQEVEVIDVNDDSEEDVSNQQNDDEAQAVSSNVVEESDDEVEEPHSKKQRVEADKESNDSESADV